MKHIKNTVWFIALFLNIANFLTSILFHDYSISIYALVVCLFIFEKLLEASRD